MEVKCENLQVDEFSLPNPSSCDEILVPDIGSTVDISENQAELVCDSPSKVWTGKRAVCSFSANNNDLDDYPFHAVTYGEPGELHGLPYNDHNYAKVCEDEASGDNQLALLAKVALSGKESNTITLQRSVSTSKTVSTTPDVVSSPVFRNSNVPHVTIIKAPFLNQSYQSPSSLQPATCKVATTNGRTILLTPNRGSLGASVQIHRVSSVKPPQVLLRTDFNSANDGAVYNGISNAVTIRCICGYNRDDGFLIQCTNCKIFQHAECMAPSSNSVLPKPYLCELCQPRPVMVSEAVGLQRRKLAISAPQTPLTASTIRLANPATAFRLPRSNHPTIAPNRFFLTGSTTSQNSTSLSVRPIQVRLGETGATLYQVDSTTLNQFSPRFINLDASALTRQPSQPSYVNTTSSQRTSKRKQDLFTLAGESTSTFDNISNSYSYEESSIPNGQHISVSNSIDQTSISNSEGNDLPGPKFYRTPSQAMNSVVGVDNIDCAKVDHYTNCDVTLSCGVPEPNSADVVIRSDSYEKAAETRLSEALKQRIRNIFLSPSERELKTLQMADSFALSRGQQKCRVTSFESGRKGLVATESIYPNQPIIEYKGYAMLMDEYSQQHDYKRRYNPFVLFYKQLDKAVICLDASNYGNEARFIRRSCIPNCEVSTWCVHMSRVRLTFPPTDSFSSVVNPQCIQFVITSAVNRVIPVGTELTVGFDFDYTACSYPVRCACGRGPSLCAVADWFRRHRHLSISQRHRIYSDTEEKYGDGDGGGGGGGVDYDFDNEDEMSDEGENDLYDRNRSRFVSVKPPRSRIPFKRLLNPKRVSPAFSRVPYPSAKQIVHEQQYRRHSNGIAVGDAFPPIASKRGTGRGGTRGAARGSGRGRGLLSTVPTRSNQPLRAPGRPRGRPPNSGVKRNSITHRQPLPPPPHSENEEEEAEFCRAKNSIASSSPQTDVTEPSSTSPWRFSRSPAATTNDVPSNRVRRFSGVEDTGANRKRYLTKDLTRFRKSSKNLRSPMHHRSCRRPPLIHSPNSPQLQSPEGDNSVFTEKSTLDVKSPQSKAKRVRKLSGRNINGLDGYEKSGGELVSSTKRPRRQSDFGAYDSHIEEQNDLSGKEQSRSSKFREDRWLAEVMRRIERMEKKRSKRGLVEKKPKIEKSEETSSIVEPKSELHSPKSPAIDGNEALTKRSVDIKDEEEAVMDGSTKKRRSTVSGASGAGHSGSAAQLSREDRWMQMQLQRIAEMESTETPVDTPAKRRRASSGNKISGDNQRSSTKKELGLDSNNSHGMREGEEECSLIVYKRREQDPMAKFSRSRTALHHSEQNYMNRSYSLVESFLDEDLPAGGELLDDHVTNGGQHATDGNFLNAPLSAGSSSPPKPSKKRWLSQALMEEDRQHQQALTVRTTPSPEESLTPPDSSISMTNSQNQRALNPKKRIISQLEEAMASQQIYSPPNSEHVSPSSDALATSSKLPPKKRQSEEESSEASKVETECRPAESPPKVKPKQEKVRMSLSEYRRRRGLSTASMESGAANKISPPQQQSTEPVAVPPLPVPSTPPGSPQIDLKRLPTVSALGPLTEGPRTPSEPPSEDEADRKSQHPLSAPASLPSPPRSGNRRESASAERFDTFSIPSPSNSHIRTSLPNRPPLDGCDRHLSGHAQRRASPPPPPALVSESDTTTPTASPPNAPPLIEHLLRRDREIIQWQMERQKHSYCITSASQIHHCRSSSGHRDCHHHERSGSYHSYQHHRYSPSSRSHHHQSSLPPTQLDSNSSPGADGNSNNNSVASASAFNHHHPRHDMEGIRESLMQTREHLQARLSDLQKAAAGGSG
ncbi:unnamed protein product [Rodentolepis nana]|uniref:SET domain-containing protein n=1 Tax=Rodentolepis nana TaxID=102285 RepID=A0A0R3T342_RODNA|nr:unnamed protein product [Rodentolepis nana]